MRYLIILAVLTLVSCEKTHSEVQQRVNTQIRYIKDARTGLCFAYAEGTYTKMLATVPCDKVRDFLPPGSR